MNSSEEVLILSFNSVTYSLGLRPGNKLYVSTSAANSPTIIFTESSIPADNPPCDASMIFAMIYTPFHSS